MYSLLLMSLSFDGILAAQGMLVQSNMLSSGVEVYRNEYLNNLVLAGDVTRI